VCGIYSNYTPLPFFPSSWLRPSFGSFFFLCSCASLNPTLLALACATAVPPLYRGQDYSPPPRSDEVFMHFFVRSFFGEFSFFCLFDAEPSVSHTIQVEYAGLVGPKAAVPVGFSQTLNPPLPLERLQFTKLSPSFFTCGLYSSPPDVFGKRLQALGM